MKAKKQKYMCYEKRIFSSEYHPEDNNETEWIFIGETYAVSAKQAINNIKYRKYGEISQYLPVEENGRYSVDICFKAVGEDGDRIEV